MKHRVRVAPGVAKSVLKLRDEICVPRDPAEMAAAHCHLRNCAVMDFLLFLALLKAGVVQPSNQNIPGFKGKKARYQSHSGPAWWNPAAHVLPCQIYINGDLPETFTNSPAAQHQLKMLFGRCMSLTQDADREDLDVDPVQMNVADRRAEANGLAAALEAACNDIFACPSSPIDQLPDAVLGKVDRHDLADACKRSASTSYFDIWEVRALQAYRITKNKYLADLASHKRRLARTSSTAEQNRIKKRIKKVEGRIEFVDIYTDVTQGDVIDIEYMWNEWQKTFSRRLPIV